MVNRPLVSVVIPTKNSGETLEKCLESIENQTYKNNEVIIVDSFSNDKTLEIAKRFSARIISTKWKLLGSRYLGFKESKGQFHLMFDSDQILKTNDVIERALNLVRGCDMLAFEEFTYNLSSWISKLFEADRKFIHKFAKVHLDPIEGVILPRFYRQEILNLAFKNIPKELFPIVVAHDHAIIYYEAYKISQKIKVLPNVVWHIEPTKLTTLWEKNFRYGKSTYKLTKSGYYKDLLNKKVRFRKGAFGDWKLGVQTYLLLILKGVPYYLGCFFS